MKRRNRLARLYRALDGGTQESFAERTEIHPVLIAQYELDKVEPGDDHLVHMAEEARLTVATGEQILDYADALRQPRQRGGQGIEDLFETVRDVYQRSLSLILPEEPPKPEDRVSAGQLWPLLEGLTEDQQLAVVRVAREFQSWALMELVCEASVQAASKDLKLAARLARLGREIAEQVRGPEGWRNRVRGFAAAFPANVLRVKGELEEAKAAFKPAKQLWLAGSDPYGVLDPGRLLDLEASLLRDQRHFQKALDRLDEAIEIGHARARCLINKGFTYEVMGEYEAAIDTLLQAEPDVQKQGDPRLLYMQRLNLAVNYCHTARYEKTMALVQQGREIAAELGDEIGLIRAVWLDGRIAAGLGRTQEALSLLGQSRRQFAARKMWADAALALLEEAALLLDERRTAEVKELSPELTEILKSKGLHREALAALRLFQEAVEHETATAELARRVLRYLFRARHDQGLRFES